jgi:hypothetical protein
LRFAPFNGGYPEHAKHLRAANLDVNHNLWYDIFDHNDPGRTRVNWSLLPVQEYEQPWFPAGECERAVPITTAGVVVRTDEQASGSSMQSFGMQQLVADAQAIAANSPSKGKAPTAPAVPAAPVAASATAPPLPATEAAVVAPDAASSGSSHPSESQPVLAVISAFVAAESPEKLTQVRTMVLVFTVYVRDNPATLL